LTYVAGEPCQGRLPPKNFFKNGYAYVLKPNDDHEYALAPCRYKVKFAGEDRASNDPR